MGYTKCRKCGRAIPDDSRKCSACGAPLRTGFFEDEDKRPTLPGGSLGPAILLGALLLVFLYMQGLMPGGSAPPAPTPAVSTPVAREEKKFGLSEAKRREVFHEILLAEDYVQVEADRRHPPLDPSASSEDWQRHGESRERFRKQATGENERAIAKRFGVTVEALRAIADEGIRAAWPRPPRRSLR